MQQKEKGANKLKIGCSEDPKERLEEIKRQERNDKIKLLTSIKARKMRDAETAAQDAVKKIGLKKDRSRGGSAHWYIAAPSGPSIEDIKTVVSKAVRKFNAKNK